MREEEAEEVEETREVTEEEEAATEFTGLGDELERGREIHEHEKKEAERETKEPLVETENRSDQQTQSLHLRHRLGEVNRF